MANEPRIGALLKRIGIDANAATQLLILATEYWERGEALPKPLSDFLAQAINRAMHEPSADRAAALVYELGLTAPAKQGRPAKAIDYGEVVSIVEQAFADNEQPSETQIKKMVADRFGVSPNTTTKHVKPAMLVPSILRANKLDSLILPRKPKG
jgi:hypothetical protein